ncbi:CRP-like cAMP-binding protein [Luteimonas terrae]|uniref:CRP-like cAMP-binding protein n=1 Tax=Luteimonas terrae TaxID=1530191 RepID=A0ABU1XY80_9GAMM|nr:CRP-like cAMP-binding protein [Luteimonas terrae]
MTATIALVAQADEVAGLQITLIGREGIFASPVMSGATVSPLNARVRSSGWAWRLGTDVFQAELTRSTRLRGIVDLYFHVLLSEAFRASACARFHGVQARLARWLLTMADGVGSHALPLKAQVMADMLGVRRAVVTLAMTRLERRGLIRYSPGLVSIVDLQALGDNACSCYRWSHQLRQTMLRREAELQPVGAED